MPNNHYKQYLTNLHEHLLINPHGQNQSPHNGIALMNDNRQKSITQDLNFDKLQNIIEILTNLTLQLMPLLEANKPPQKLNMHENPHNSQPST